MNKKRLISAILLLAIGFRTLGWVFVAALEVREARREMRWALQNEENSGRLLHFSFSGKEFVRLRTRRGEFRFNGELFDVKKVETRGDSVFVTALSDERETGALGKLAAFFHVEKGNSRPSPRNAFPTALAQLLLHPFLAGEENLWQPGLLATEPSVANFIFGKNAPAAIIPILSPPPERLC